MAKKILYKVTAYHCPRCGGVTKPTKRYCEYCERELNLRNINDNKNRLIVDCGNFVNLNANMQISVSSIRDITDTSYHFAKYPMLIKQSQSIDRRIDINFLLDDRGKEIYDLKFDKIHRIRFESLDRNIGFEQNVYISEWKRNYVLDDSLPLVHISLIGYGESKMGEAIPQEIINELRCPNCGAPIKSRYGACDYCSGWSEIAW